MQQTVMKQGKLYVPDGDRLNKGRRFRGFGELQGTPFIGVWEFRRGYVGPADGWVNWYSDQVGICLSAGEEKLVRTPEPALQGTFVLSKMVGYKILVPSGRIVFIEAANCLYLKRLGEDASS